MKKQLAETALKSYEQGINQFGEQTLNTGRLKELIERISNVEGQIKTQEALKALEAALTNVVGAPQDPNHQNNLSEALSKFAQVMDQFEAAFPPHEFKHVLELNKEAFSPDVVDEIDSLISLNSMSPNVVNDFVKKLYIERQAILTSLASISEAFDIFSIGYSDVEEDMAELGFQIPRKFFSNDLRGLINELSEIERMLRFFSEATVGHYEPVKVGAISTTDPLIFLAMIEPIAVKVGSIVQWALTVWVGIETIRALRAQALKTDAFTEGEVESIFGKKIKAQIDQKVESKVQELLAEGEAAKSRKGELSGHLNWALRALLSKVERGMTIELRIAPPTVDESDEEMAENDEPPTLRQDLKLIQTQLLFPEPSDTPVLEIPHDTGEGEGKD